LCNENIYYGNNISYPPQTSQYAVRMLYFNVIKQQGNGKQWSTNFFAFGEQYKTQNECE
jgi:hypothetical protein